MGYMAGTMTRKMRRRKKKKGKREKETRKGLYYIGYVSDVLNAEGLLGRGGVET